MKVKIYTFPDKAPEYLNWQYHSFKKLRDDWEMVVLNNSSNSRVDAEIKMICRELGIRCHDVLQKDFSTGCFACYASVQDALDQFIAQDKDCYSLCLDSDLFLMNEFSVNEYMEGYDLAYIPQSRDAGRFVVEYMWNAFFIINNSTCPNLQALDMSCGVIGHAPLDVGGQSYYYLKTYPELRKRRIKNTGQIRTHPDFLALIPEHVRAEYQEDYAVDIVENAWIHLMGGSRWDNKPEDYWHRKEMWTKKLLGI